MVHLVWQRHNIRPSVFMGLANANDPFTDGERAFCFASEAYCNEHGERPTNLKEFASIMGVSNSATN